MKTIIDRSECNPLSDNIEGKLVVIKPDFSSLNLETQNIRLYLRVVDLDVMPTS